MQHVQETKSNWIYIVPQNQGYRGCGITIVRIHIIQTQFNSNSESNMKANVIHCKGDCYCGGYPKKLQTKKSTPYTPIIISEHIII